MSYWSYNNGTLNGLTGAIPTHVSLSSCGNPRILTQPDETNPEVLTDEMILYALRTSEYARADFRRIFPSLNSDEQDRLTTLLDTNPRVSAMVQDEKTFTDLIQHNWNTRLPVHTSGPRGGNLSGAGGNNISNKGGKQIGRYTR